MHDHARSDTRPVRISNTMALSWETGSYEDGDGGPLAILTDRPGTAAAFGLEDRRGGTSAQARWLDVRRHMDAWLNDPTALDALLARSVTDLAGVGPPHSEPVGATVMPTMLAHLLGAHGVDPRGFGALAACRRSDWSIRLGDVRTDISVTRRTFDGGQPVHVVTALLHPVGIGILDTEIGEVALYETLPQSVLGQCPGRPLRDVVSHPWLDGHDLTIVSADDWVGSTLRYAVDHVALRDIAIIHEDRHASEL